MFQKASSNILAGRYISEIPGNPHPPFPTPCPPPIGTLGLRIWQEKSPSNVLDGEGRVKAWNHLTGEAIRFHVLDGAWASLSGELGILRGSHPAATSSAWCTDYHHDSATVLTSRKTPTAAT